MSADTFGNLLVIVGILIGLLVLAAYIASLFWVYTDAQKRGKTGCMWILLIFFTWPFGLVAYLLLRDQEVRL